MAGDRGDCPIFLREVVKNRKLTEKQIKEFSKGKVYLGKEAKELGLINYFGDKEKK
jgi:ClpP class serine protease